MYICKLSIKIALILLLTPMVLLESSLGAKASGQKCVVADPTGTPLNVRTSPNGRIINRLENGFTVLINRTIFDSKGRPWHDVSGEYNGYKKHKGWVFGKFIDCNESLLLSVAQRGSNSHCPRSNTHLTRLRGKKTFTARQVFELLCNTEVNAVTKGRTRISPIREHNFFFKENGIFYLESPKIRSPGKWWVKPNTGQAEVCFSIDHEDAQTNCYFLVIAPWGEMGWMLKDFTQSFTTKNITKIRGAKIDRLIASWSPGKFKRRRYDPFSHAWARMKARKTCMDMGEINFNNMARSDLNPCFKRKLKKYMGTR